MQQDLQMHVQASGSTASACLRFLGCMIMAISCTVIYLATVPWVVSIYLVDFLVPLVESRSSLRLGNYAHAGAVTFSVLGAMCNLLGFLFVVVRPVVEEPMRSALCVGGATWICTTSLLIIGVQRYQILEALYKLFDVKIRIPTPDNMTEDLATLELGICFAIGLLPTMLAIFILEYFVVRQQGENDFELYQFVAFLAGNMLAGYKAVQFAAHCMCAAQQNNYDSLRDQRRQRHQRTHVMNT